MTVAELIEALRKFPEHLEVMRLDSENGNTAVEDVQLESCHSCPSNLIVVK